MMLELLLLWLLLYEVRVCYWALHSGSVEGHIVPLGNESMVG